MAVVFGRIRPAAIVVTVALIAGGWNPIVEGWGAVSATRPLDASDSATENPYRTARYGSIPLYFVRNEGQASRPFSHTVSGGETALGFGDEGVVFGTGPAEISQRFLGATPSRPEGVGKGATFSWFTGEREDWITAPSYERLRYKDVWPGVDVVYTGLPAA